MKRNLFEMDETEKSRILEMHQTATSKQYLTEQVKPEISNITITDYATKKGPEIVNVAGKSGVAFPKTSADGKPTKGDIAAKNNSVVMVNLGGNYFLVIGQMGKIDENNNVIDSKPGAQIFEIIKSTNSFGSNVKYITNTLNPQNGYWLIATICKSINKSTPSDTFKTYRQTFIDTFKLASSLGITPLNEKTLDAEVQKYLLS